MFDVDSGSIIRQKGNHYEIHRFDRSRLDSSIFQSRGELELKSAGPIAFGPEGILFIADTKAAAIAALATGDTKAAATSKLTKIEGINQKIAGLLGASADQIL